MCCAAFTIVWMKIKLEWHSIVFCSFGAVFGLILGKQKSCTYLLRRDIMITIELFTCANFKTFLVWVCKRQISSVYQISDWLVHNFKRVGQPPAQIAEELLTNGSVKNEDIFSRSGGHRWPDNQQREEARLRQHLVQLCFRPLLAQQVCVGDKNSRRNILTFLVLGLSLEHCWKIMVKHTCRFSAYAQAKRLCTILKEQCSCWAFLI